jgi:pteridine reductase
MGSEDRVALVTGGSKRVGASIARKLAEEGFHIALTYNASADEAQKTADEIRSLGRRAEILQADLTQAAAIAPAVTAWIDVAFGRLDVLVNNASIYTTGGLFDADLERMRRMWAIHVETPMLLCRSLASLLRENRGHVINMLDQMVERPAPRFMAYLATKAGLWNLTMSLARELAPEVTVNGIAPGVVAWPPDTPEQEREQYLKRVPLNRSGTPRDVANAVAYLCQPGSYVTGQVIRLDGGRSMT